MALVACIVISSTVIIRILIEGVIGQVHVNVVHVRFSGSLVSFSTKPCKCHLVNVDPQRTDPIQEDVDPQVIFQIVDQVRSINILLYYVAGASRCVEGRIYLSICDDIVNQFNVSSQKYSVTLRHRVWFDYVGNFAFLAVVLVVCKIIP